MTDVVGECEKCGRQFLSMPNDGLDHYDHRSGYRGLPLRRYDQEFEPCLGKVITVNP